MKSHLLPAALLLVLPALALAAVAPPAPPHDARPSPAPRIVHPEQDSASAQGLGTQAAAYAAVAQNAATFDGGNGATYSAQPGSTRVTRGDGTATALRFDQSIGGIPVFGAQLVAVVRPDGRVATLAGEASHVAANALDLIPAFSATDALERARETAAKHAQAPIATLSAQIEGLRIYDPALVGIGAGTGSAALAWQVSVRGTADTPIRQTILIDAHAGHALLGYSTIHTAQADRAHAASATAPRPVGNATKTLGMPALQTYSAQNNVFVPGAFLCDESSDDCTGGADPDADRAHFFARGVYDLYANLHQRDSLDGNGLPVVSTVHFATDFCNAFWDPEFLQMVYGDGCNIVLDDVVGHELTHGVTDFTSGLIYAYESGAINESLSDVWGEYFDLSNGSPDDTADVRWVIGEDVEGGLRNMRDPGLFSSPDRMSSPDFWTDPLDVGGVHFNSAVNNKAAYLLADGDTFNGQAIAGLGLEKPLHIYYYAQTTLLTPTSNYADLGHYLAEGCKDLIGAHGIDADDCAQVEKAVLATEMRERSPLLPDMAAVCAAGEVASDLVFDDFEDAAASKARWSTQMQQGGNAWRVSSLQQPLAGQRSLRADDLPFASDSTATLDQDILVPADAWLHFKHRYVWEYDGYDGSVPQFSTDGGATWTTFAPELLSGERYPGIIFGDVSIGGAPGFAGDSLGDASTRIDLAGFAGQTLRLRFRASSDISLDAGTPDGWWIDDVRVYTCTAADPDVFSDDFE